MKTKITLIVSAAAVVLFCGFIFYMSAQPADDSDIMSMGIVYRIISIIVPGYADMSYADQLHWQSSLNHIVRKAAHFSEFAFLGILMANLLYRIAHARQGSAQPQQGDKKTGILSPVSLESAVVGENAHDSLDTSATECASMAVEADAYATAQQPRILALGLAAWLLTTAYAATDEIHQLFVPGRAGMLTDVMLDSAGALTGVALFCIVLAIVRTVRNKRTAK